MEIKTYIRPLIKWWWLLLAAALVASVASFFVTNQQPPIYQARTTLLIGRTIFEANPNSTDLWMGQQLASFYVDLTQREPVRNATMASLGLSWLPQYIAQTVPNSPMIIIIVTDTSPERAQVVANELAKQLIRFSPTGSQSQNQERQTFIQQQLTNLETQIKETSEQMAKKQDELGNLFSARQIADAQTEISALQNKLTTLQSNYALLLANTEQGASNILTVFEEAMLPTSPIGPRKSMMVLLATAIGVVLAASAAYLLEYLDDTLKSPDEINRALESPIIGQILEIKNVENEGVYVAKQPRSIVAESFRSLRTNLEFTGVDKPLKTLFVTSTGISEGKTFIAVNLAAVMAQGGKRVILLDADLRRPRVHNLLGLSNQKGLSDVFRGSLDLQDAVIVWNLDNFGVVTSGKLPPNPADLLTSQKMDKILASLGQVADIVIIDGPPFLVAEAGILANKVDGVLLVVKHAYTRRAAAATALDGLKHADANIVGIVVNGIPRRTIKQYGQYQYDDYYSGVEENIIEGALALDNGQKKLPGLLDKVVKTIVNGSQSKN
jgi:capsular exopolysaccharide synthesis family protein